MFRRGLALLALGVFLAGCGADVPVVDESAGTGTETGELTEVAPAPATSDSDDDGADDDVAADAESSSDAVVTEDEAAVPETNATTTVEPTTTIEETTTTTATTTTTTTTTTTVPEISTASLETVGLEVELVATLSRPVGIAPRPGSSDLFVIEQSGRIVRLPQGFADGADTTLDLRGQLSGGNEQGLLGLAFDPAGERLYVNYTDGAGTTNIVRYDMAGNTADAASAEVLLAIEQPLANHNGGHLAFGPDGFLYIGMGDGGGGGDPFDHGQNPNTLHGAILRIDVSDATGYSIPADNPFVDGAAPEVFVWGIRNAWRFGFDSANGDLWIGDVGQNRFEEITVLRDADGGGNGANLGWNAFEGSEPFSGGDAPVGHVGPIVTYAHTGGRCSITGGEVYRGGDIPGLSGTYLYGDFCTGEVFGYRVDASATATRLDLPAISSVSSFGLDNGGVPYVISRTGGVFRIVAG